MNVNRTARNNTEKAFFELLEIRIFLTDDVILTSQFVAVSFSGHTFI